MRLLPVGPDHERRGAADGEVEVRRGTADNPRMPEARQLALREAGKYSTRNEHLARNPALPATIMEALERDPVDGLRRTLKQNSAWRR